MSNAGPASSSPRWGPLTKLAVGLTFIAIIGVLLVRFRSIVGPLLVAFVLSYLLFPVAASLSKVSKLSWRMTVNVIFLIVIVFFGGVMTLAGFTIVQQVQSLYNFVGQLITDLPKIVASLSTQIFQIGPYQFSFQHYDVQTLVNQILSVVQPLLGRAGGLVSTLATSAISTLGWSIFVVVISYFLLADAGTLSRQLVNVEVPGYEADLHRLVIELRKIWNAYLRGQLIIILLVMAIYTILLTVLGVRYAVGIAILAGLARFVPYVGPFVTWTTLGLVAYSQGSNYLGLSQFWFAVLVVVLALAVDQVFDNLVSPRIFGDTLGVHPAAVLVAALIAANLIGIIGLVLAAPVLATINLVGRYILRKMFDLDPWPEPTEGVSYDRVSRMKGMHRFQVWFRAIRQKILHTFAKDKG
jgi:predicted PurR-regulated permease PerM